MVVSIVAFSLLQGFHLLSKSGQVPPEVPSGCPSGWCDEPCRCPAAQRRPGDPKVACGDTCGHQVKVMIHAFDASSPCCVDCTVRVVSECHGRASLVTFASFTYCGLCIVRDVRISRGGLRMKISSAAARTWSLAVGLGVAVLALTQSKEVRRVVLGVGVV